MSEQEPRATTQLPVSLSIAERRQELIPVALVMVNLASAAPSLLALEQRRPRLSRDEQARIARIGSDEQRQARLAAHVALRLLLERYAGVNKVRGLGYQFGARGRPHLPGSGLEFSISYGKAEALIALAMAGPIGVDLEAMRRLPLNAARRQRIMAAALALVLAPAGDGLVGDGLCAKASTPTAAAAERETATEQTAAERETAAFLRGWTRLEAVAKATDLGLAGLLGRFDLMGPGKPWTEANDRTVRDFMERRGLILRDLDPGRDRFAALALPAASLPAASLSAAAFSASGNDATCLIRQLPSDHQGLEAVAAGAVPLADLPPANAD